MNYFLKNKRVDINQYITLFVITGSSILSLLPFFLNVATLKELLWFGDAWDLLNQLQKQGLLVWVFSCFAENFVPVFKLLWIGSIKMVGGSYFTMLSIVWATHAVIVFLYGLLLARVKIGLPGLISAILLFGISWTNIETLTWSVQWSSSLSVLFFLVAFHLLMSILKKPQFDLMQFMTYILFLLCSLLSFSRGIIGGVVLGSFCLLYAADIRKKAPLQVAAYTSVSLGSSLLIALIIYLFTAGNHKSIFVFGWGVYLQMLEFASTYFFFNPLASLFHLPWMLQNVHIFLLLAAFKIIVIYFSLRLANTEQRRFIIIFLFMDLCNAVLLGLGRYHTGLSCAIGYRYQYVSYICFGISFSIVVNSLINEVLRSQRLIIAGSISSYL